MHALVVALVVPLLVLTAVPLVTAGPAHGGTPHALEAAGDVGYRYWSYWQLDAGSGTTAGRWVYATQGPSVSRPADGDVEGYRFEVSEDAQDAAQPRGPHGFAAICDGTPAEEGAKRIAFVIDFGTPRDAPQGEAPPAPLRTACARVAADASSAEALAAVAPPLRYNSDALLCAIAGYPRAGCGEQVSGAGRPGREAARGPGTDAGQPPSGHRFPSAGIIAGVFVVALLGVGAVWQARRRRG